MAGSSDTQPLVVRLGSSHIDGAREPWQGAVSSVVSVRPSGKLEGRRMIAVERNRLDRLTNPRLPCQAAARSCQARRNTGAPKKLVEACKGANELGWLAELAELEPEYQNIRWGIT
ncbi:hypothetical protein DHEL01_v212438 [Diaporthe helianthi]|uniref:Uncharacterized protein n=1 Tax=Diaporthe helianthi TaxID=158607 RepID=A0A2P5HFY9_DIAHE|nr:hypothetical protein DHEL01_v212438 [Diaporthe helianthi]